MVGIVFTICVFFAQLQSESNKPELIRDVSDRLALEKARVFASALEMKTKEKIVVRKLANGRLKVVSLNLSNEHKTLAKNLAKCMFGKEWIVEFD